MIAALVLFASAAQAVQVSQVAVFHRSGQTFITWTSPPGTGWIYRIYTSNQPIITAAALSGARMLSAVEDSTWYDRRYSVITGATTAYRIDPLAAPLDPTDGLYVHTVTSNWTAYYAVTAQEGRLQAEDRTLLPDVNTLTHSVREQVAKPEPVFQRMLPNRWVRPQIYTLWTTDAATPEFPAMANMPGIGFDLAVVPGNAEGKRSLMINMHARTGNLLQGIYGTGMPGEWVLSLDDPLRNTDSNTFWYGYHEGYDTRSDDNTPPMDGVVHDYTMERVVYSLEWVERTFPIDRTRVYASGFSMGGIGSVLLAMRRPDLIAGVMTIAAKFDFSFVADPNPLSGFNLGNSLRQSTDRLWGEVSTDLPTSDGASIYHRLNDGWVAGTMRPVAVPPIIAFNGRNDITVGWAEKIPFYRDIRDARQGGTFFWDPRDHAGNSNANWSPAQDVRYLYRFRTDLSFPALTSCSADDDPGDGNPAVGDSVGCINGWVEWDTTAVDRNVEWCMRMWTRDLATNRGWQAGPDSVTVDVTPRRLQEFRVVQGTQYHCTVVRESDGAVIRDEVLAPDESDLLTIRRATIYKTGTRVHIEPLGALAVDDPPARGGRIRLALTRNPVGPLATIELSWPAAAEARVDLVDVSGRVVRTLMKGPAIAGPVRLPFTTRDLSDGVYFLVASQLGERAVQRAVVLR